MDSCIVHCFTQVRSKKKLEVIKDVMVVNKVLEEDDKVVEEVNKKLVKEYNDFFVVILHRWKVQKIS